MTDTLLPTIVMCKAPVAGQVKTRLMARYSAAEARAWHEAMATTVIARAKRLFPKVILAVDDVSHPFFERFAVPLVAQGEGDLGTRMQRLMQVYGAQGVMFLGTDSPHMPDARLLQAVAALGAVDVVWGAVEDGGYDLIAMRRPHDALFSDIDWSTAQVLQQSIARAEQAGLSYLVLDVSFDVDTPETLERALATGWQNPYGINCH